MKTVALSAQPINLSLIVLNTIQLDRRTLIFQPPLSLKPKLDQEDNSLLVIEQGEINLHVYAPTRKKLYDDLIAELFFLWDEYAKEKDENMTAKARKIKASLLARCQEH